MTGSPSTPATPLFAAMVEKFSLGRSTGFQVRNWQNRYLCIFPDAIGYYESEESFKKGGKPKFQTEIKNFSLCILQATEKDHIEAKGPLLFILRVWDSGVFDLLVRSKSPGDKAQFMAAIRQATAEVKGFQMVGDADVLGGEDRDYTQDVEELEVPNAGAPTKRKKKTPASPAPPPPKNDSVDEFGFDEEGEEKSVSTADDDDI